MLNNLISFQNNSLCDVASPVRILEESNIFHAALIVGIVAVIVVASILINKALKKNAANKNNNQQDKKL